MLAISQIEQSGDPTVGAPKADFSRVISKAIASYQDQPAEIRRIVYELARVKLQQECSLRVPLFETLRLLLSLEIAIERVESQYQCELPLRSIKVINKDVLTSKNGLEKIQFANSPAVNPNEVIPAPSFLSYENRKIEIRRQPWKSSGLASLIKTFAVATFAVTLYAALTWKFDHANPQAGQTIRGQGGVSGPTSESTAKTTSFTGQTRTEGYFPTQSSDNSNVTAFPLPSVYGVYALSNGQLSELHALPGTVPDSRVFMSTAITKPSETTLADGKITFVVYRRDLAMNAPDRVTVGVIAKVVRAMTFDPGGKVNSDPVKDTWTIRNVSHEFRVAPLRENPDILLFRQENSDFIFPAGRYGLVVKGQAYDFTVAGPITDPIQCLERVEAVNGSFYTECRKPS